MPAGAPPGLPPLPPSGMGIPNNLGREVEGNAYTPPLEDPDRKETDPIRWHLTIEPIIIFHKGIKLPVTATSGDSTLDPVTGALGEPTTTILHGGQAYGGGAFLGGQFRLGYMVLDQDRFFVDASYFISESRTKFYDANSNATGSPVLTRPFFNPTANSQDADPRAFPNILSGSLHDETRTEYQGGQANFKWNFTQNGRGNGQDLFFVAGPRWFRLDEYFHTFDSTTELPAGTGSTFILVDHVDTSNTFFGVHLGPEWHVHWDNFSADVSIKGVFGSMHQRATLAGLTQLTDTSSAITGTPGTVLVDRTQGFYVQPSNGGSIARDRFTWGPEFGLNLAYMINDNVKLGIGYNFFYIDKVIRPGDQIDTTINIQPLFAGGGFGVARPLPQFRETNWVTQTINFSIEVMY